ARADDAVVGLRHELRREAAEEPDPVLDDRPAEREAEVNRVVEALQAPAADAAGATAVDARDRLADARHLRGVDAEWRVVEPCTAVELVGAGLRDHVGDAAHGAAVLGVVAAGDDLRLLDEVEAELAADEAVRRVGGVEPVDEEVVLEAGRAPEGRADRV